MLVVVVLAANLVLENFVEPKVMGRTLDIHPLLVLIVTALGGLLGGIVGQRAAELARPAVHTCSTDLDAADPLILRGHFGNHPI
jgi:hypothetical protein